jgi:hypothetical protein
MRRRLAWIGGALLVLGTATAIGLKYPNTGKEEELQAYSGRQAQVYREPKRVELTREQRARALATAANFITHAVARRRVEQAYDLAAPSLKSGISRRDWRTGNIPVVPFPVEQARWRLDYSDSQGVGLQVLLLPTAKSRERPGLFHMELIRAGGKSKRWLVSSFSPSGVSGGGGAAPAQRTTGTGGVPNVGASIGNGSARLDQRWLLAPLGLIAFVPLLVAGFFLRSWRRDRRAEAAFAASSPARELPPLRR